MRAFHAKRFWFWIAIAAITIAIFALLVPHAGNPADQQALLALFPVFFVGLLTPLGTKRLLAVLTIGHAPEAPALAPSFQRPPPFLA